MNLNSLRRTLANFIDPNNKLINKYNESLLWASGGGFASYDVFNTTYLEKGYNFNPIVYAIINQMATKTASIPYFIKKVEDTKSFTKLKRIREVTRGDMSIQQKVFTAMLEKKALSEDEMAMPLERPNVNQSWTEFFALYKTYLKLTGNVYIYTLAPEDGPDSGAPHSVYLLPSQFVEIVLRTKNDINTTTDPETPISGYILVEGNQFIEFKEEEVIHIKYPNPNAGMDGEHLYGQSPLRAALRNIENSNVAIDLNIKTLKSGGAFGFLHGKRTPITPDQAAEMKERLVEMNKNPEDMSKIAGVSAEIGFTRISLTSEELKPFDYLNFDQKMIANVLQWSDKLLNNDQGAKYDNISQERKRVISDNIVPDLKLLEDALNLKFLPLFKGYENTIITWDVNGLPEMQDDIGQLSAWLSEALDRGVITRNEYRLSINFILSEDPDMDLFTVSSDVLTLSEAVDDTFTTETPAAKVLNRESQRQWDNMLIEAKIAANGA